MDGRCDKLRSLQRVAERLSQKAAEAEGHGNTDRLIEKLNGLSDQMNSLLAKTAVRQVVL